MNFLMEGWQSLSPRTQRFVVIGGAVVALGSIVYVIAPTDPGSKRSQQQKDRETVRHVLTDTDTRKVSLDSLSAQVQLLQKDGEKQQRLIEKLQTELVKERKQTADALKDQMKRLSKDATAGRGQAGQGGASNAFAQSPLTEASPAGRAGAPRTTRDGGPTNFEIRVVGLDTAPSAGVRVAGSERRPSEASARGEYDVHLPAGSILPAILITGIDAPTGQQARREPFPILARLNKDAVLPNDFRADVRECFAIIGTYGDLSSERVFGRGETISCIRTDGKVLESKLEGFMAGSDGKNGLRGRLVSRSGTVIARAAAAGFFEGLAGVFGYQPVPVIATGTPGDEIDYQKAYSSEALRAGVYAGGGKSFERIADYYMKMTDQIQPVLEVDNGRVIDVILTGPLHLRLRDG